MLTALLSPLGCAALSPERTAEQRREVDEENQRKVMKRELVSSQRRTPQRIATSPSPPQPPLCNETRSPGIYKVTCRAYSKAPSYTAALLDQVHHLAAESTLAAGKTHFQSLGIEVLGVQTTQPICHEEVDRTSALLVAIGNGFSGAGAGGTSTSCSTVGNHVECTTTPRPPPARPKSKTVCEGGGVLEWIDHEESFEFLTEKEAAQRSDPLIPESKRPYSARAILAPSHAIPGRPPSSSTDPFEN